MTSGTVKMDATSPSQVRGRVENRDALIEEGGEGAASERALKSQRNTRLMPPPQPLPSEGGLLDQTPTWSF